MYFGPDCRSVRCLLFTCAFTYSLPLTALMHNKLGVSLQWWSSFELTIAATSPVDNEIGQVQPTTRCCTVRYDAFVGVHSALH